MDHDSWYTCIIKTNMMHFSFLIYFKNLNPTCFKYSNYSSSAGSYCIGSIFSNCMLMSSYCIQNMYRVDYWNKLRKKSASCWSLLHNYYATHNILRGWQWKDYSTQYTAKYVQLLHTILCTDVFHLCALCFVILQSVTNVQINTECYFKWKYDL